MNLCLYICEEYLIFSKTRFTGDWHTAYLLLYGPRKLPKDFKKADQESEAKEANVEKMETWLWWWSLYDILFYLIPKRWYGLKF